MIARRRAERGRLRTKKVLAPRRAQGAQLKSETRKRIKSLNKHRFHEARAVLSLTHASPARLQARAGLSLTHASPARARRQPNVSISPSPTRTSALPPPSVPPSAIGCEGLRGVSRTGPRAERAALCSAGLLGGVSPSAVPERAPLQNGRSSCQRGNARMR